jgi:hypothetical protein
MIKSVDYVCLRPHIPYNHCPINNDLNNINESETIDDNDYCDSVDGYSVAHKNSSYNSVIDETLSGDKSKKRRESIKSLINHKRLSKLLCI